MMARVGRLRSGHIQGCHKTGCFSNAAAPTTSCVCVVRLRFFHFSSSSLVWLKKIQIPCQPRKKLACSTRKTNLQPTSIGRVCSKTPSYSNSSAHRLLLPPHFDLFNLFLSPRGAAGGAIIRLPPDPRHTHTAFLHSP